MLEGKDKIFELLGAPLMNIAQSFLDSYMNENQQFRTSAGMRAIVQRILHPPCCEWCVAMAGTYDADDMPEDIYRRHDNCDCEVLYTTEKDSQNVHTKEWISKETRDKIRETQEIDFYGDSRGRILTANLAAWIGDNQYSVLMEKYTGTEARKYIRTAYRKSSIIGDGGTAAVREFEIKTGLNLGREGRSHAKKVGDLILQINKSLKKEMPQSDRIYLEKELLKLKRLV